MNPDLGDRSLPADWTALVTHVDSDVYNISELEASDLGADNTASEGSGDIGYRKRHSSLDAQQVT